MLHTCLVSEELPPETGWGGIGTYTHAAATGLAELGHRVDVVARTWEREEATTVDGVTVHRVPVPEPRWRPGTHHLTTWFCESRSLVAWSAVAARAVARIHSADPIDVVEAPEYHAQAVGVAVCNRRLPLVVRLHTPTFLCNRINGTTSGGSRADVLTTTALERIAARRADLVTSPSRDLAHLVSRSWHLKDVVVLPNPMDDDFVSGARTARCPGRILFVGRLEHRKGVDVLADALPSILAHHPEARVAIVGADHPSGPGGTMMGDHLRRRLSSAGIPESAVELRGALPRASMPQAYAGAAICVVPSRWENFPYTCLEAMASGCAVVASRVGGLSELVEDGVTGLLVEPGDPAALASAIGRLLDCPAEARRLGEKARSWATSTLSRRAVCTRLADVYGELVRRRP